MNRKPEIPKLVTREGFALMCDRLARKTVEIRKLEANRDDQLQKLRTALDICLGSRLDEIEILFAQCEAYALEHRAELLPTDVKSADTELTTFGFRTSPPKLALLSKKWSWEKVALRIRELKLRSLLRVNVEADKEALKKLPAVELADLGCKISQDESFYIEPKEQATAVEARSS